MTAYRHLTGDEVHRLEAQCCVAEDWDNVTVAPAFSTRHVCHVRFSGIVRLGVFESEFVLPGGIRRHAGLHRVTLHNVSVDDNCYIGHVRNYIANYDIGHDTFIENVGVLLVDGTSRFGNGVEVSVLDETGGRKVSISDRLSAHQAYIEALYRHRPKLIARLKDITNRYADRQASSTGTIGHHVTILNTDCIRNVRIGDHCRICGAARLSDGSLNSNGQAPVHIGHGVICDHFIVSSGSHIADGVVLSRCFVGQACKLGRNYSAGDSLFFCNSQGENGEACAVFAGPFTVTHHKSTLLIAGMFSFMNAGSGTNQSNHMYKLGPIHQGILERGCKTASDSYVSWPARIGAFSLVMGRHTAHPDTSDLPFSYLIGQDNVTCLIPGVSLRSAGTVRDAQKWPKRDGRTDPDKPDCINYELLTPYTVQKMFRGREILRNLRDADGGHSEVYSFHNTGIRKPALVRGIRLYGIAICKFLGDSLIRRLESVPFRSDEEIRARLRPDTPVGSDEWVDISGLVAPKSEVDALTDGIESGRIDCPEEIDKAFKRMHNHYSTYAWTWAYGKLEAFYGIRPDSVTAADIVRIVEQWKEAVVELDRMLCEDAAKEFSPVSMTGFGIDGSLPEKEMDFRQVRGDFGSNPFVTAVQEHIRTKTALGDGLIMRLRQVR